MSDLDIFRAVQSDSDCGDRLSHSMHSRKSPIFGCSRSIVADRFLEILKPFDLSSEQYNVLRILRGQKGKPANMSVIQERMISKNSNTTRLVDKLIVKEFVIRKICPSNKRKMEITTS